MAHRAYLIALGGKPAPEIDGFTGEQRFYLGWAQVWARKYREDELRKRLLIGSAQPRRVPRQWRACATCRRFDRAFGVKEGDKLYLPPDQRRPDLVRF